MDTLYLANQHSPALPQDPSPLPPPPTPQYCSSGHRPCKPHRPPELDSTACFGSPSHLTHAAHEYMCKPRTDAGRLPLGSPRYCLRQGLSLTQLGYRPASPRGTPVSQGWDRKHTHCAQRFQGCWGSTRSPHVCAARYHQVAPQHQQSHDSTEEGRLGRVSHCPQPVSLSHTQDLNWVSPGSSPCLGCGGGGGSDQEPPRTNGWTQARGLRGLPV